MCIRDRNTNIHLILLPSEVKGGGGKFIAGTDNIVIESNLERMKKTTTIEIIIHELIHLYFEYYLEKTLYPRFSKEISYHQLKEIIARSLLPYGYLSFKYFNKSIKQDLRSPNLIKLVKNYIELHKPIDESFIKECIEFYNRNKET